ncbi:MAG TPA: peptidylprolyl isomerase [Kofleriaceae bacterium]|nr:peptidylprolyl isomerase [Kofleriaceae bacterium]
MRSTCTAVLVAAALVGCGNKKHEEKKMSPDKPATSATATGSAEGAGGAAKPDDMKPEPVAKAGGGDEVRAPTADDLAAYTKDLQGSGPLTATFDTSEGTIHCELLADKAPMTVANFVGLATGQKAWTDPKGGGVQKKPFYDGLIFHRVIPGFMIQGGDPLGMGTGGPGYDFGDEVNNGLTMAPGTLAMANAGPGTNGSQFFITDGAPGWLNNKHTIFGKCKEVDVVKKIESVDRGPGDKPNTPVTIKSVKISRG